MKRSTILFGLMMTVSAAIPLMIHAAKTGDMAPNFSATASDGKTYKLDNYRGKFVVLEWHNSGCPFTRKHYDSGNMQRLQKEWTAKGVVWFTVISSAPGAQGFMSVDQENDYMHKMQAVPTAALLDSSGALGHLYDAKTTPQLIVIDPHGVIVYDGAIDDHPTPNASDIPNSKNYVDLALQEALSGKPVTIASSRPYGCSVKYSDASH